MTATAPGSGNGSRQYRGSPLDALSPTRGAPGYTAGSRGRISDYVYEELGEAIRSLRLEPGAPLSEPAVAAWLNVSRAPVREAFTRLADQGLITIVPQVGSQVAPISMRDVDDAVFVRSSLETGAFRQTIASGDADVTELQRMVDLNREAFQRGDSEAFFETDEQLHQIVFGLAGVPHIWEVVRGMKTNLDRLRRLNLPAAVGNEEIISEHQWILDAIARRDEAAGVAVIHQHSHRILTDTVRLQDAYPEYFTR